MLYQPFAKFVGNVQECAGDMQVKNITRTFAFDHSPLFAREQIEGHRACLARYVASNHGVAPNSPRARAKRKDGSRYDASFRDGDDNLEGCVKFAVAQCKRSFDKAFVDGLKSSAACLDHEGKGNHKGSKGCGIPREHDAPTREVVNIASQKAVSPEKNDQVVSRDGWW